MITESEEDEIFNDEKIKKMMLSHFVEEFKDYFSEAIDESIENIKLSIKENEEEIEEQHKLFSEDYKSGKKEPTEEDLKVIDVQFECSYDLYLLQQQVKALAEMKVIYLYKSFEITIKAIIKEAYPEKKLNDFYKWKNLTAFFKAVTPIYETIEGFYEVNQLRELNNQLKHSGEFDKKFNTYEAFKNASEFTYDNIHDFYLDVSPSIEIFLYKFVEFIFKDLEFNVSNQNTSNR